MFHYNVFLICLTSFIHSSMLVWSPVNPVVRNYHSFQSAINGHYIPVGGNENINLSQLNSKHILRERIKHIRQPRYDKSNSGGVVHLSTLEQEDPLDLSNELRPLQSSILALQETTNMTPKLVTSLNKSLNDQVEQSKHHFQPPKKLFLHNNLKNNKDSGFFNTAKKIDSFSSSSLEVHQLVPATGPRGIDAYLENDELVYEDIYPKRVPKDIHTQWQKQDQALHRFLEQKRSRQIRRLRLREQVRRRPKGDGFYRYRTSKVRRWREQRSRSYYSPEDHPSLFRSFLGVSPFCLNEKSSQYSCMFTPSCWMAGGIPKPGCSSLLYSCCVTPSITRKDSGHIHIESGRGYVDKRYHLKKDPLKNEPECGITPQNQFSKRIIGGEKTYFAELPWQVHIRISSYQCGGVLLNHWYIATAAHCVHQAKLSQITVHLGEYDTKNTEQNKEPLESESFKVDHIALHPEFRYMLTQPDRYDIALLKLDHAVYYRENIIPICLPTLDYPLEGKVGIVAGWGKTDNSFGKTGTNLLHKVLVPIIENKKCRAWHKDKAIAVQLHEEMFCAGHKEGKQDACLGDSGGPLVINFDGRWTLVGITSAGFGCAVEKQPGIYHKVSKTARWISSRIKKD